jgi:hypothetical protein
VECHRPMAEVGFSFYAIGSVLGILLCPLGRWWGRLR